MSARLFSRRIVHGVVATTGLVALWALPALSEEPTAPSKEVVDLEKQIESLNKRLVELKKANGAVPNQDKKDAAPAGLPADWVKAFTWRSIGPASMGGRITAISVFEGDPTTFWIATASGGLLKTTNNGTTFEHQFDKEATVSIGDVCVAPSDKNIVWVGTGENNPRNSVSYGDGVYKSTDGGKTWKNMGLRKTYQIGRLAIHPTNPNIVYVGALGRLYGPNEDRGLYKTTDGGATWNKIFYIDDKTGVIDMRMSPNDPETLIVAMWERERDGFDSHRGLPFVADGYDAYDPIRKWGPGAGLHKTTDGGKTWKKLTKGLPSSHIGRVGLDYYRKDPKTVFAVIDCAKIGMGKAPAPARPEPSGAYLGVQGANADAGAKLTEITDGSPAAKAGLKAGDIIIAVDGKIILKYEELVSLIGSKKPGDKMTLKVSRNREGKDVAVTLERRPEEFVAGGGGRGGRGGQFGGGSPSNRPFGFQYGGQRENADQGPNSHEYGGVYKSTDGGESWTRINSLNPRPMYFSQVRVDPSDDKYLYILGVKIHRSSDGGKTFRPDGSNGVHDDKHALWIDPKDGRHMIVGCDGGFYATYDRMTHWDFLNNVAIGQFYHVAVDSRRPYRVYGGLQDNASWGGPSASFASAGPINEDWVTLQGGDGFVCRVDANDPDVIYCESQDGAISRRNLRTGEQGFIRPRQPDNWPAKPDWVASLLTPAPGLSSRLTFLSPLILDQQSAAYRFNWNTPFILSAHNPRIFYSAGNYVFRSLKQGSEIKCISPNIARTGRGTGSALSESPRNADVLYAGTDDGFLWVTRDGGAQWTNVTSKVPLPGPRWVATLEASRHVDGRVYACFDAHRSNDDEPYVFLSEDYGQSWKSIRSNLPTGSTRVLREDPYNAELLYCGTEFGIWVSVNRGATWTKFNNNLPTVAVHEVAIHPTAGDIIVATHGRSIWIVDVTPLRQITADALKAKTTLYQPNTAVRYRREPQRGSMYGTGSRHFVGTNPSGDAQIYYSLNKKAEKANIKILDISGKALREMTVKTDPGLNVVTWDLRGASAQTDRFQQGDRPAGEGRRGGGGGGFPGGAAGGGGGGRRGAGGGGQGFGGGPGGFGGGPMVATGTYRVVLTVDGIEYSQNLRVEIESAAAGTVIADEEHKD
jgi:photosystem II stability/assembly factor-like uncharacterized protein